MVEKQNHGLIYERLIINKYNLTKSLNYNNPYDAFYMDIPVQIKCIKYKSYIDFGSYLRNLNKNEDFILVIGFWQNNKANIIQELILYIDYQNFIKNLYFDKINEIIIEYNNITNNKVDDTIWKNLIYKTKLLYPKNNLLKLKLKRDHKSKKRLQCSLPYKNIDKFIKEFKLFKFI